MNRHLVAVWGVLLLLPLLPVIALYALFDNQNFFKLEDTAKGILAAGPIGAYFALVWLGCKLYKQVSQLSVVTSPALKHVIGDWDFGAESKHGTVRSGHFTVEGAHGVLSVRGTFVNEHGVAVGNWDSKVALLSGKSLTFVYDLQELRDAPRLSEGMTHVTLDEENSQMSGTWVVVGAADAYGTIKCSRAEASE